MEHPDLEKKLKELLEAKKQLRNDFTRKTVDAINKSEQVTLTHMSIMDTHDPTMVKGKKLKKKKLEESNIALEEPEIED